jgi:tRNA(Ile)-lysidine synthase
MADTPTSKLTPNNLAGLDIDIQTVIQTPVAVAFSGGADSTALLLMLAQQHPGQVRAIHIHHGLQAAADDFAAHCDAFCSQLGVLLHVVHVNATAASGQSPEDAARRARYTALSAKVSELNTALAQKNNAHLAIKSVAIAQHADDQIETLLLALSRGAGLPGLSSMPAKWQRDGIEFVRPLLGMPSLEIRSWLAAQGLAARHPGSANIGQGWQSLGWIEDPTNSDTQFTRNRIRHALIPALEATFPQFRQTFARSAAHAAQAQSLLVQVAVDDMATTGNPPKIAALQALPPERQANALRHWLKSSYQVSPSTAQLAELQSQLANCTDRGKQIHIKVASGHVARQGDVLVYLPVAQLPSSAQTGWL